MIYFTAPELLEGYQPSRTEAPGKHPGARMDGKAWIFLAGTADTRRSQKRCPIPHRLHSLMSMPWGVWMGKGACSSGRPPVTHNKHAPGISRRCQIWRINPSEYSSRARSRLADPQVQALWRALLLFQLLPAGFSNRDLRQHFAFLLGQPPQTLSQGQMTYHLRRFRLHRMIERTPKPTAIALPTTAREPYGSAPEPAAASSARDSEPYCRSFPHPTPRSGPASINLMRRSQLGSNTQN